MKLITVLSSFILAASMTVSANIIKESNVSFTNEKATSLEASVFHNPDAKPIAIDAIKVIEIEESVSFDFNVQDYLPENFNPLKGKHNLDWSKIELIEIEEEVSFDFNPKDYLPQDFNPHACTKTQKVCIN